MLLVFLEKNFVFIAGLEKNKKAPLILNFDLESIPFRSSLTALWYFILYAKLQLKLCLLIKKKLISFISLTH